ncbi:hypothetical protein BGW36DRAFT_432643 [Talaromyces proteolyticus]|uniref:LysM domain-containing protein n=1 Tax=Talaromyces proteolyticus TaxID=1131652 RepID=A0AAD4PVZ6_9EURO|nr:uncharacterized protein BGW36DRAFT_432643 [Talaromyces proteolyticus]KAH8690865.1 hypothetical protein BGW36DRAFT_432643 [Talaromyces proteolyticus]
MSSHTESPDFLDPAISSASSSRRVNTSIRPRNRRLITVNDDEEDDRSRTWSSRLSNISNGLTPPQSRGTTPSPYASRRGSPLPQKHPSRATEREFGDRYRSSDDEYGVGNSSRAYNTSHSSAGFLESSWSSIQSLASSVLGNEISWGKPPSSSTSNAKRRKPSSSDILFHLPKPSGPTSWGPSTPSTSHIGTGTMEERQALVQAKKREVLLLANGDSVSDLKGRYKRKDSMDRGDTNTTEAEQNEEALVYIHPVQPSDTMTGISIKYGCQLAIFRKANGFWPSDSIQARKIVLLPAEACSVKGRRINKTQNLDLLGDEPPGRLSIEDPNGSSIAPVDSQLQEDSGNAAEGEQTWKHEAWVQMEGFTGPVEIGRVLRKSLGFFPRSRRRSISVPYSDIEPSSPPSEFLTTIRQADVPTISRRDSSPQRFNPSPRLTSATNSPATSIRTHHKRSGSITLSGPRGVGTLGRDVHAPGPAPDGLNKFFSQHLPHLTAPPPPIPTSRKASFDSTSSVPSSASYSGLENVGGAIEGWMRKVAIRAKSGLSELQQGSQTTHGQTLGISGMGDLIELDDGLEGTTPPLNSRIGPQDFIRAQNQQTALGRSQYERFSSSSAATNRARSGARAIDDPHKND